MAIVDNINEKQPLWRRLLAGFYHLYQRNNSIKGARRNISAHYDLSNDFFQLFLDKTMAYSSGIFTSENDTLEQASLNKFKRICDRLQLTAEDHLLEIGSGWGGLAIYAAKNYGCRVTTITLSQEQYDHARNWIAQEGLSDLITVKIKDYRNMSGRFTRLVSIEMIEAVGAEYYPTYFRTCSELLTEDGLMLIQAITISDQRYEASIKTNDFIKSYIFPGGQLPSNHVISRNIDEVTDMQLIGLEDITASYALTLKAWRENFWQNIDKVRALKFSEEFIRMWHYYLCFCEGAFRERVIHTAQFLAAKPEFRKLPTIEV
jgi:cyclopropane-fatty-acyl-phospholipid synthase